MICIGRLANLDLDIGSRFPKLLPSENNFTDPIIEDHLDRVGHLSLRAILAEIRTKFLMPKDRQYVKRILNEYSMYIRL